MNKTNLHKLLLIDDDQDDCIFFRDVVNKIDPSLEFEYITSVKGVTIERICNHQDIIFLDINMPDRNGFELLRIIREKGYTLPIVIYSTASHRNIVEKAYREGADVYFPKPDSIRSLEDSLKTLLSFDWDNPGSIRDDFYSNGHGRVFRIH